MGKDIGKILGSREPGRVQGFRPGGRNGYNQVGGQSGLQVKIPKVPDASNVVPCQEILRGAKV